MLDLTRIQIQIQGAVDLRRRPLPEDMNQTHSASQFHKTTQLQNSRSEISGAGIGIEIGGGVDGEVHPLGALGLGPAGAGGGLADDGAGVDQTEGAVVEIEGTEVGVVDGDQGNQGEIEGGIGSGIGVVVEREIGEGGGREVDGGGVDAEDDEGEDEEGDAEEDEGGEDVDEAFVGTLVFEGGDGGELGVGLVVSLVVRQWKSLAVFSHLWS